MTDVAKTRNTFPMVREVKLVTGELIEGRKEEFWFTTYGISYKTDDTQGVCLIPWGRVDHVRTRRSPKAIKVAL